MHKIGLKLWSCNTGAYLEIAEKLVLDGICYYIELYVVPGTEDAISHWQKVKAAFIIHNAHFAHGFNLARKDCEKRNSDIYRQTRSFADRLGAEKIIFHGGIDGSPDETARQLKNFSEPRALLENKPFKALPNRMNGKLCRGATEDELGFIIAETGCGFCLDFGHAVCSANSQGLDPYSFASTLMRFKPAMFHLSDLEDVRSPYDSHRHLGKGTLDIKRIMRDILPENSIISLETEKDSDDNLDDFIRDVSWFKTECGSEAKKFLRNAPLRQVKNEQGKKY